MKGIGDDAWSVINSFLPPEDNSMANVNKYHRNQHRMQEKARFIRAMKYVSVILNEFDISDLHTCRLNEGYLYVLRKNRLQKTPFTIGPEEFNTCVDLIEQGKSHSGNYNHFLWEDFVRHILYMSIYLDPERFETQMRTIEQMEYPILHQQIVTVQYLYFSVTKGDEDILPLRKMYPIDEEILTTSMKRKSLKFPFVGLLDENKISDESAPPDFIELLQNMIVWLKDTDKDPSMLLNPMLVHRRYISHHLQEFFTSRRKYNYRHPTVTYSVFIVCNEVCTRLINDWIEDGNISMTEERKLALLIMILVLGEHRYATLHNHNDNGSIKSFRTKMIGLQFRALKKDFRWMELINDDEDEDY
jgi:hypothetical protein